MSPAPRPAHAPDAPLARRALLTGAAGSAAALVVALTRPARSQAAVGDPVLAGMATSAGGQSTQLSNNSSTNHTLVVVQHGTSTAIRGDADAGVGGRFKTKGGSKYAVIATHAATLPGKGGAIAANGGFRLGLYAASQYIAVLAESSAIALQGNSAAGTAVRAASDSGTGVHASTQSGIGVYAESGTNRGLEGVSGSGIGVRGVSDSYHGIEGVSTTGYAGYFEGAVYTTKFLDMSEQSPDPIDPGPNQARIFIKDNGAGKTQLCVRFDTGAVQVIATQP